MPVFPRGLESSRQMKTFSWCISIIRRFLSMEVPMVSCFLGGLCRSKQAQNSRCRVMKPISTVEPISMNWSKPSVSCFRVARCLGSKPTLWFSYPHINKMHWQNHCSREASQLWPHTILSRFLPFFRSHCSPLTHLDEHNGICLKLRASPQTE
jgi:hypothetical protein